MERNKSDCGAEPSSHERSSCCFEEWMQLQQQDLSELKQCLQKNEDDDVDPLLQKILSHFEDYIAKRNRLAGEAVTPFYAPTWCTSLENYLPWIACCRPSIYFYLLYALSGSEPESRLGTDSLQRMAAESLSVGDLLPEQLEHVNRLHVQTIREEGKLTSEMASYQELIADQPIATIVHKLDRIGEVNEEADRALEDIQRVMKNVMGKADELRLNTLKELLGILKPAQAVEFLIASKKLHLSMHEWGKWRDQKQGGKSHHN